MTDDALKAARILIVDDQEANVRLLERVLKAAGYHQYRSLTDPRQVFDAVRAAPPDLLLLDLMMPGLDGFAVMDGLRPLTPPGTYLPILCITADASPATRQRALASGAKDFLTKPIDTTEAALRIRNLLETRRLHQQLQDQNLALEEQVRERTREVRAQAALLAKARDAIQVRDLDGRITFWNAGAERLYGWSAAEAVGRDADDLLFRRPAPETDAARRATLEHGEWAGELRQTTRDGKDVVVESRWSLVRDDADRPAGLLLINTDVTEKKRLEAQSLRAQRMDCIGTLAAGIAHDLNNVLTPILMGTEILRRAASADEQRVWLDALQQSAERGAGLVKQILTFARGADGDRLPVQVQLVVKETQRLLEHSLPKSIAVEVTAPRDLWWVEGSTTQLAQVLTNLCINARDAMPAGGRLTIRAENRTLDATYARLRPDARPGPYVVVHVTDTGTGIPPDDLEKIFDPFFTTKELGRGTGLGLSTVLGIVTGYGGFLDVESKVGQGTRFSVYLPALPGTADRPAAPDAPAPAGRGELVLVADDEAPVRDVTRAILEANGYRVLLAQDGAEALALYAAHRADVRLVLTDLMMPVLDGPASIRALRRLDPALPIVAMTGVTESLTRSGLHTLATAPTVLAKPFTARDLLTTLRAALDGEREVF